MKKFKIFSLTALTLFAVFALSRAVFGWGNAPGDGSDYGQLQETAVFFNDSDTTLIAGQVVVIDRSDGTSGTTLGAYVTTTTSADNPEVVGIVKSRESANDTPVVVCTRGPIQAIANDSSDAVATGTEVGSTTTAGRIGGGKFLGWALEAGSGTDNEKIYIWVDRGLETSVD